MKLKFESVRNVSLTKCPVITDIDVRVGSHFCKYECENCLRKEFNALGGQIDCNGKISNKHK